VRDRFLRYIGEQLERYHVYGVELDFMREIHCFDYAGADKDRCVSIMNDFMRSVKQTVTAAEKKKGRRIRIAVRLTCEVDKSLAFGFDARTWAKEGLVDLLIPSPRFHGSQSAIPVEEWKERCPETQILPCVESLLSSASAHAKNGVALMPLEVFRGHAASFLARGADGIYCYNLFGQMDPTRDALIHRTPDTAEELARLPRRYVTVGEDPDVCPQGFRPYQPLPLSPAKEPSALIFHTGEIPADQAVTLKIGLTEGEIESLTVAVNGIPVNAFSPVPMPTPENAAPVNTRCYAARIQPSGKAQTVTFQRNGSASATVTWCELDVQPQ